MTDAPATPTFPARQAEPGQTITWHDATGTACVMTADADGVVVPWSREAAEIADSFGLPLATTPAKGAKAKANAAAATDTTQADTAKEV